MKNRIPDKWFYFPVILLGIYFIYRLLNQSQMIFQFPLEITSDYGAHIGQLHLFVKYGLNQVVFEWYNGFKPFLFYPPGWYIFVYPFYMLTKNLLFTTFLSVIILFLIIFYTLLKLGSLEGISKWKSFAFFLLLFGNSIAIGNYVRLGRVSELTALTCFLILASTLIYYRYRKLNLNFIFLFVPAYFFLIISHPSTAIIFHVLLFASLIVKSLKEKAIIILSSILGVTLSSFWWFPFLMSISPDLMRADFAVASRTLEFSGGWMLTSLATFIVVPILFFTFLLYFRGCKNRKGEFLFFSPILVVGLLFLTRLVVFIPLLNKVYPDVYMMFFLFFSLYFLFKTDISVFGNIMKSFILIALILLPLISVTVSELHTLKFTKYTKFEYEALELLPYVEKSFMMVRSDPYTPGSHEPMYYAYGSTYLGLHSPGGANNFGTATVSYFDELRNFRKYVKNGDCANFLKSMDYLNATDIITFDNHCNTMLKCGLRHVRSTGSGCLYNIGDVNEEKTG